jgi:hypothetical protein
MVGRNAGMPRQLKGRYGDVETLKRGWKKRTRTGCDLVSDGFCVYVDKGAVRERAKTNSDTSWT